MPDRHPYFYEAGPRRNKHLQDFGRTILLHFFRLVILTLFLAVIYLFLDGTARFIRLVIVLDEWKGIVFSFMLNHIGVTMFGIIAFMYWVCCGCWRLDYRQQYH